MIKGILFDKDGTLLELQQTMHHIYVAVFKEIGGRFLVPEPLLQQMRTAVGHGEERLADDSLLRYSTNPQIVDALLAAIDKHATAGQRRLPVSKDELLKLIEELSLGDDVPYFTLPRVPEVLGDLHGRGYPLGVATADTYAATVAGLQRTGILQYFGYLGTGDEPHPKPHRFLADAFCRRFGIHPAELLVVGDTVRDMEFANTAGACFVGIHSEGQGENVFAGHGCRVVAGLDEIPEIFSL